MLPPAAREALDELVARDDPTILGLVLSGSAARGVATERSDVDVYVVRDDDVERETCHSSAIDEIHCSVADLERVDRHGTGGWYMLEARLDAGESVSWLLHVMFTLAGRLRPYNKYLAWELRRHPLGVPEWSAEAFLPELERILAGDANAIRSTFAVIDREVRTWDVAHDTTVCGDVVDSWGDELVLFSAE